MIDIEGKILVSAIKPELLPLIWDRVEPMIQKAVEYSNEELSTNSILDRLIDQKMLLVTISESDSIVACLILEKRDFDTGKSILMITAAGGSDIHLWMDKLDEITMKLAIEHNCDDIYIVGRKGWQRMLKNIGYETIHYTVAKKVRS